ncbi:hypothetical protein COS75_02045 [Candidatus Pacearchaeota archaeon CG06_land_8_20_14_3_00_35_12]|nr:MAG: hypothetical protein COS75_02045 [Candidatus Pacearchaeota archaeon CG06_land_8_20_14_3_00_35_12]
MKINKQEIIYLIASAILIGYIVSFNELLTQAVQSWIIWLNLTIAAFVIVAVNVFAKKLAAWKKGCELEMKLWTFRRFWFPERMKFPFLFPIWFVLPLIITWLSTGRLWWLAILVFEAEPTFSRVRERWTELTEWDLALFAAAGVYANIVLAVIFKAFGAQQFAMLSAWFAFFCLIPIGNLDGAKIFFGGDNGRLFWIFSIALTAIALILLSVASIISTILAAIVGAFVVMLLYYLFVERK